MVIGYSDYDFKRIYNHNYLYYKEYVNIEKCWKINFMLENLLVKEKKIVEIRIHPV